jgi:DNA-binding CsgD family transcriptional regulator
MCFVFGVGALPSTKMQPSKRECATPHLRGESFFKHDYFRIWRRIFRIRRFFVNTSKGVRNRLTLLRSYSKHLPLDDILMVRLGGKIHPRRSEAIPSELISLGLTKREAEVLAWMARGKGNYEIGVILGAKRRTISKHVEHILSKLNVENRTAAAAIAFTVCSQLLDLF